MIKVKPIGGAKYVINGCIIAAKNYKDAIAEYLSIHDGGSKPIFGTKEIKC